MNTTMTEIAGDVAVGRHVTAGGNAEVKGSVCIEKDLIVKGWLDAPNIKRMHKGLFSTESDLIEAYPRPQPGWWALVGRMLPAQLYLSQGGRWRGQTDEAGDPILTGEPTLELIGFREELDSIPCDFVYDEETSSISNCIIKLVLKNGSSLPLSLPKASMTAAGIIRAGSYKKYEEASVNGINAIEWLNEFKAKTAEDFSDVYTMMRDYADGEEFYYFKQETQNQLDLLDRKIDTVQGLHNQDMDSIADEIKAAKGAIFDDMFLAAAGQDGDIDYTHVEDGVSKPYYLNELWLTYEEVIQIMELGKITNNDAHKRYVGTSARTVLPARIKMSTTLGERVFENSKVEKINASLLIPGICCFKGCAKLETILNIYSPNSETANNNIGVYGGCTNLKSIKYLVRTHACSFSLADSPLIDRATLALIVQKKYDSDADKAMTITVHEEVYAKLTGDPNSPYLIEITVAELQEWMELVELAAAKNITFACA